MASMGMNRGICAAVFAAACAAAVFAAACAGPVSKTPAQNAESQGKAATPVSSSDSAQVPPLPQPLVPVAAGLDQLWAQRAPAAWLALFEPEATIHWGRRSQPDAHDVVFDVPSYGVFWRYQLEGLAPGGSGGVKIRDVSRVESEQDRGAAQGQEDVYEWTVDFGVPGDATETVRYRASLSKKGGGVSISGLRRWPLVVTVIGGERLFDAAKLADYDTQADAIGAERPREKAEACRQALRFAEAADWYEKVVSAPDASARDWLDLGWASIFAGRLARAEQALVEARKEDPAMPMFGDR